tara:strand:- start:61 stop:849 length:789 start_codon:yes stop_codon:yes gene_type:complete
MLKNIFSNKKESTVVDDEPVGIVYKTKNYSKFKFSDLNRDIDFMHVSKIKKSMMGEFIPTIITINNNMEITDGQHRFKALEQLNRHVIYFMNESSDDSERQIIISNTNTKNWQNDHYLALYVKKEKKKYPFNYSVMPYHIFSKGREKGVNFSTLIKLAYNYENKNFVFEFRKGNLIIDSNEEFINKCNYFERIVNINNKIGKHRCFQGALLNFLKREDFDIEYFINKIEKDPYHLENNSTITGFEMIIKKIYNYRNFKNKII